MIKTLNVIFFSMFSLMVCGQESLSLNQRIELTKQLDSLYSNDQKYRRLLKETRNQYGNDSNEMKKLWRTIEYNDPLNLITGLQIINQYGWLSASEVGEHGNQVLFLIIQHSDLKTMETYLPIMKDAVRNSKASSQDFALLQDRVEILNNRPQIYGTQIKNNNGKFVVYEIVDEANVNKRRADVGLGTIEEYLKTYDIEYKKK